MRKGKIIALVICIVAVLFLVVPIPMGSYDDGGTKDYCALTYRVVMWKRYTGVYKENGSLLTGMDGYPKIVLYENTSVYWFPDNLKSLEELWEMEFPSEPEPQAENTGEEVIVQAYLASDKEGRLENYYELSD